MLYNQFTYPPKTLFEVKFVFSVILNIDVLYILIYASLDSIFSRFYNTGNLYRCVDYATMRDKQVTVLVLHAGTKDEFTSCSNMYIVI